MATTNNNDTSSKDWLKERAAVSAAHRRQKTDPAAARLIDKSNQINKERIQRNEIVDEEYEDIDAIVSVPPPEEIVVKVPQKPSQEEKITSLHDKETSEDVYQSFMKSVLEEGLATESSLELSFDLKPEDIKIKDSESEEGEYENEGDGEGEDENEGDGEEEDEIDASTKIESKNEDDGEKEDEIDASTKIESKSEDEGEKEGEIDASINEGENEENKDNEDKEDEEDEETKTKSKDSDVDVEINNETKPPPSSSNDLSEIESENKEINNNDAGD